MKKMRREYQEEDVPEVHTRDVFAQYRRAMRPYRGTTIFIFFMIVISGLVDIVVPLYYRQFFDTLAKATLRTEAMPILIKIILIVLGLKSLGWVIFRVMNFANNYFQSSVMADLKQQSFDYMIEHSYTFFANRFTGSLVQRVNRFSRSFERLADRIMFNIIPLSVRIVGISTVAWFIKPVISAILISWVAIFLFVNYLFSRWKLKYDLERAAADSMATGVLSDAVTNHNTIQLFTGFRVESKNFEEVNQNQARLTRFTWHLGTIVDGVQAIIMIIAEFVLFYFAIRYWGAGLITIGTFVLIQAYLIGLVGQLWDFSRVVRDMYESFADAKEMVEILKMPHEIHDRADAKPLVVTHGKVEFDDVNFSFNKTRNVLKNINLTIRGGEKVALVGPSGAGKSTFVRLVLRLYDVGGGKILIDGQDVGRVTLESLRANISLVPQDPILFHRTLLENIRYGRRDASDGEVKEAGRLAHCEEFIRDLPAGYDTYVGERGIKLSGGERQRVAIARAILKNAPVLVLDEATSSLDSHSEALIQEALAELMQNKTTIVIAHRLSTIRKMDRIIVIRHGAIIEDGTHDELNEREDSLYHKLWTLQAGGFLRDALPENLS